MLPLGIWLGSFRAMDSIANKTRKKQKQWPEAVWLFTFVGVLSSSR